MDQQLRLGRIEFAAVDAPHQTIAVDIVFQGNQIKQGIDYFGVWRDDNEESVCPFILDTDGNADFGTGYSGEDRVYEFDIFNSEIGIGREVGWRSGDYETAMKITKVTQLV